MLTSIHKSSESQTLIKQFIRSLTNQGHKFDTSSLKLTAEQQKNLDRFKQHKLYISDVPELMDYQHECQDNMVKYNQTFPTEVDKRSKMLKVIFAEVGEGCCVETPINANWGCKNVHLGNGVYINSNVTFVDDDQIYIGDNTLIAPNVMFTTAGHPICPSIRERGYQFVFPIHVGKNVWLGAGVQIMPGVTIGDNSVIAAGSVVTKDIPPNCVAMGIPCKVVREIGEKDNKYYFRDHEIDLEL